MGISLVGRHDGRFRGPATPLHQLLDGHVKHRSEDETEEGDTEHAGEHRDTHRMTHLRAGAAGDDQRHHAHDEGE